MRCSAQMIQKLLHIMGLIFSIRSKAKRKDCGVYRYLNGFHRRCFLVPLHHVELFLSDTPRYLSVEVYSTTYGNMSLSISLVPAILTSFKSPSCRYFKPANRPNAVHIASYMHYLVQTPKIGLDPLLAESTFQLL